MREIMQVIKRYQNTAPVLFQSIIKEIGLTVYQSTMPPKVYGSIQLNFSGNYEIRINKKLSSVKVRFVLAHELSHLVLHSKEIGIKGIIDDNFFRSKLTEVQEHETNILASDILIPRKLLLNHLPGIHSKDPKVITQKMANIFKVPEEVMAIKLGYIVKSNYGNFK